MSHCTTASLRVFFFSELGAYIFKYLRNLLVGTLYLKVTTAIVLTDSDCYIAGMPKLYQNVMSNCHDRVRHLQKS